MRSISTREPSLSEPACTQWCASAHRFFKVKISGKILEGPYDVEDAATGSSLIHVDQAQMRRNGYFTSFLPGECLCAHTQDETSSPPQKAENAMVEVQILLPMEGRQMKFLLRQNDTDKWDIIDGSNSGWVRCQVRTSDAWLSSLTL